MNSTLALYEDRRSEIEFYYSVMSEIENNRQKIQTTDNAKFQRILKSNFLLMLYNMVEACVVSGMMEIYEDLKNSAVRYADLTSEIKKIWSNNEIAKVYDAKAGRVAYEKRVQRILNQVISEQPIVLNRGVLGPKNFDISGNLDAQQIKKLCDKHGIRYVASDDNGYLKTVREKRNDLAHGDESFGNCARDMTLKDIEHIKDEVCGFIKDILDGMKSYHDNKQYLLNNRISSYPIPRQSQQ